MLPLHPRQPREDTIHEDPDLSPTSSIHEDVEYTDTWRALVLACWHSDIPQVWVDILNRHRFYSPALREFSGKKWLRFETRDESFRVPKQMGHKDFWVDGHMYSPGQTCMPVFHHTRIEYLVGGSPTAPGSTGILEQGLCFGTCTHQKNSGVNYYSASGRYGFWTYDGQPGWVGLELAVTGGTSLKNGSAGKYCINRASLDELQRGRPDCPLVGIMAMWVLWEEAPDFVKC